MKLHSFAFGNISNPNQELSELEYSFYTTKFWIILTVVIVILPVSVAINLKVLATVTMLPRRKRNRPANILIGHFSTVAIIFSFFSVALVSENAKLISLSGHSLCKLVTYVKCVFIAVFSLNSTAIVYERFRTLKCNAQGTLLIFRIILLTWIVSLVAGIPAIAMTTYVEISTFDRNSTEVIGICQSVLLFGSLPATIVYELTKLILFHLIVVVYMAKAIYTISLTTTRIHLLRPARNSKMMKKVRNIRFIYVHFVTFILIWLPSGILVFTHRVLRRTEDIKPAGGRNNPLLGILVGLLFTSYFVFTPLIYLCLMEDLDWCTRKPLYENSGENHVKVKVNTREKAETDERTGEADIIEMVSFENNALSNGISDDLSRVSTYKPSSINEQEQDTPSKLQV